jgi:hypothetical protein|tara:strand:+ start:2840 stop:2944 length:105 start_codon:yes stop_codon:yes gene_type:complete
MSHQSDKMVAYVTRFQPETEEKKEEEDTPEEKEE